MGAWTKLAHLLPSRRRAEEREMREELEALREIAGPRELGNLTLAAENARETWTWIWLERLGQDLRYATRSMLHHKTFTLLAVLSLALGIGANTAIYSFMESILLRSLPVREPESLVIMKWRAQKYTSAASSGFSRSTDSGAIDPNGGYIGSQFPYPALEVFRRSTDVVASAFAFFVADRLTITVHGQTDAVKGHYVSGDYFPGIGVTPAAGRLIHPDDDHAGSSPVGVVGYGLATRYFGNPGAAVGQVVRINDTPFSIVGVAPSDFFGAEPGSVPQLYVPIRAKSVLDRLPAARMGRQYEDPNWYWIEIMGRLQPGVSAARAQAVLAPQFRSFVEGTVTSERERSALPDLRIVQGAGGLDSLRSRYSKPVYVLMAMVGLILLIACANMANLLMARAAARRREIAVRLSIGASRSRIIRQFLTESVALSTLGGVLGLLFAWWGIGGLTLLLANGRDNFTLHAELNWHVLVVTLALSVAAGLLFGLFPAFQSTRVDLLPALKDATTGVGVGPGRRGWSRIGLSQTLVVGQIALSMVLLVAAGLFVRTLSNLHAIEVGFNREDVLLFTIEPRAAAGYEGPALNRLYGDLQRRLEQMPGVRSVSLSTRPLPTGGGTAMQVALADSPLTTRSDATPDGSSSEAGILSVGPAFFGTLQIPLQAGREFDDRDQIGSAPVAIINGRLARNLGSKSPVGRRIVAGETTYDIVGVVGDALFLGLKGDLWPMVYFPYTQSSRPPSQMTFELRAAGDALGLAPTIRQIVRQADPRLAISDVMTQTMRIDQRINQEIALARLCSAFGALALIIAAVGLYATVAFSVTRRTSEIGIRMALGAQRSSILWLVLRSILVLELVGLAIAVPIVFAGSRYVESLLYGIQPNDPITIAAAVAVLFAAGLLASYLPARRASSIDPLIALRCE